MNPTRCPHCQSLMTARAAMLALGRVIILMECQHSHQELNVQPVSRFGPIGQVPSGKKTEYLRARNFAH